VALLKNEELVKKLNKNIEGPVTVGKLSLKMLIDILNLKKQRQGLNFNPMEVGKKFK